MKLPNKTHPDSPVGSENNNKIVKVVGDKPKIINPRSHLAIGEEFDLFDF
jgi:seryl-tRNA synthetase